MTRRKRERPLSDAKPRSGAPPGWLVPFFALLLVAGLFAGEVPFLDPLRDLLRARSWAWFVLYPLPFVGVGAGGIWWVVWSRRKTRSGETAARGTPSETPPVSTGALHGPLPLKSRQGPVARSAGAGCVALFWNGIVGVFAGFAAKLWIDGEGSWLLTLFLVPFVLVGVALLLAFLKSLRALGTPRPVLTLEPAAIPVGGSARLSWAFPGRAPSISVFQVTLEGSEEATYSRGTDRVTDRALFHRSDVVLTLDPHEAATGSATVAPPAGAVPSFSAPSNRVLWLLRLTARIHGKEDLKEEYEVTVAPPEPGGKAGR